MGWVSLAVILVALAWLVLAARPVYFWEYRQLYFTKNSFQQHEAEGLWTYAPKAKLVEAALYQPPGQVPILEYLCRFETNGFGLVATNWGAGRAVDYLVLGDSFTQGSGGCPWLTSSRFVGGDPVILNGGLQGVGMQSHLLLARWLRSQVAIRDVILIASSQTFVRTLPLKFWDDGNRDSHFLWYVEPDVLPQELLALAAKRQSAYPSGRTKDLPFTHLSAYIDRLLARVLSPHSPSAVEQELLRRNFAAFSALKADYPQIKVILVPEKHETGLMSFDDELTENVRDFLTAQGVAYMDCPLHRSDFLDYDGHPSQHGYDKIARCLWSLL
jgi:hypothetical protein